LYSQQTDISVAIVPVPFVTGLKFASKENFFDSEERDDDFYPQLPVGSKEIDALWKTFTSETTIYGYVDGNPVNRTDPLGLYGTSSCVYWEQACNAGANKGRYECTLAPTVCSAAPNDAWSMCVRECLQEKHQSQEPNPNQCSADNNVKAKQNIEDHLACWSGCAANSQNPFDNRPMSLPNKTPTLY
jgi:hypothetical protein